MAVYTVYYDASGKQEQRQRPLVVAGLLSSTVRWRRFEREWERVLKRFKVPYSHMREFAHSVKGSPFEKWKDKEEKRKAFIEALVAVLHQVKTARITRVVPADFDAVNQDYDLVSALGSSYPLAAGNCVGVFERLRSRKYRGREFEHILEEGDSGQRLFNALVRLEGINPTIKPHLSKQTGRYVRPFEAADLVAYEYGLAYLNVLSGSDRPLRESFRAIRKAMAQRNIGQTQESLRRMCLARPDLFPPRR